MRGALRGVPLDTAMSARDESISSRDYTRLCNLIYEQAGIHLGSDKKTMLEVRIKRRLHHLKMHSYGQYCDFLFDHKGMREELVHLIDVVTTNKTDFFREPGHFDYMTQKALPDLTLRNEGRPIFLWSAACSTGEEPYTMAVVLNEYAVTHPGFRFRILATDISTTVLEKAQRAVYTQDVVRPVPPAMLRKYFMRGRDKSNPQVRVVPEVRSQIEFRRLNFMDTEYGVGDKADIIFCRNALIYFDRPTQQSILTKLCRYLQPQGYLFVGHAETLHELQLPLRPVAPSLYRRIDG